MKVFLPRIEIALAHIQHNSLILSELYGKRGISVMGVSKAVLGNPAIAAAMIAGGVKFIADSRLENIKRMKKAGIIAKFVLLRTALSQAESVIDWVDISLNTELATIQKLDYCARIQNKIHPIILMVELGDLREGIMMSDLSQFMRATLKLSHITLRGIGCNLACYGGIKPDDNKMQELSRLTNALEKEFGIYLEIISGGNSANYQWYQANPSLARINNLRLGESIFLGRETVNGEVIPGLYTNAFQLIAEVIEAKDKPSLPFGTICRDAFGHVPDFGDRGIHQRIIIALGRQDVMVSGLTPPPDLEILGSSSDHIILESHNDKLKVGSEISFNLDYGGLLSAMTSPFVKKRFVKGF